MMRAGGRALAGLGLAALIANVGPTVADEVCPEAPIIRALSQIVLDKRETVRFAAKRYGAVEAYLLIRYGGLDDPAAAALLRKLVDEKAFGADELALVWAYAHQGEDDASALLEASDMGALVSRPSVSVMRALAVEGANDSIMSALATVPKESAPAAWRALATATIDLNDYLKADLAVSGQAVDPVLAAALVASRRKAKAWTIYAKGLDPDQLATATQLWSSQPALVGNPRLPRTPEQGPLPDPEVTAKTHSVIMAAAREPEADFLVTLLNQTGWIDEPAAAADAVAQRIDDGTIEPKGTLELAWIVAYDALLEQKGETAIRDTLAGLDARNAGRSGRATVLQVIDWAIALETLARYLRGTDAEPAALPIATEQHLTPSAEAWQRLATAIHVGETSSRVADDELPAYLEMLVTAGKTEMLADRIAHQADGTALKLASEYAKRLDRLCEGYLTYPTEALTLVGAPVFRFE